MTDTSTFYTTDSKEARELCLNCKRPRCAGSCYELEQLQFDQKTSYGKSIRREIIELYRAGKSGYEILKTVGRDAHHVRKMVETAVKHNEITPADAQKLIAMTYKTGFRKGTTT